MRESCATWKAIMDFTVISFGFDVHVVILDRIHVAILEMIAVLDLKTHIFVKCV